ncbi:MAG: peptidase [Halobacteriovoraceae bacterium]|nr:peptidase [Halobacteriovoraceae bacterium]|tara:strand:- start:1371 stop:2258 length:888 start_codon:yes stop_codon:yes gene_type:complete
MKKLSFLLVLLSTQVFAESRSERIIYGVDNRVEPHQASELQQKLSLSTAGMINRIKVVEHGDHAFLPPATIVNDMGLCPDEKFSEQPSSVVCSGFLVAPDLLVTAGHCIPNQARCDEVSWVFDYKIKKDDNRADMMVPKSKIYKCAEVIEAKLEASPTGLVDYALVKLDRVVDDREPLKYRTEGKIADGQEIFVIGHPSGLPTKVAGDAKVTSNSEANYFEANLDTFGGNSGSAVFNATTGIVEGILVRGAKDYVGDEVLGCARVFEAPQEIEGISSLGESVSRITDIKALAENP